MSFRDSPDLIDPRALEPRVRQLPTAVDKAPRPPHVITLNEVLRLLQDVPKLEGLIVAWSQRDDDDQLLTGARVLGRDSFTYFLASQIANSILNGDVTPIPYPSDK